MPATGSSDMPATLLKLAKSTGNADTVAKKVDEDDFKEHAVGDGGGNRHGSRVLRVVLVVPSAVLQVREI